MIEPDGTPKEQTLEAYAHGAKTYDDQCEMAQWKGPQKLVSAFKGLGLIKPEMNVVDFGTGTGLLIEAFRGIKPIGLSLNITGMDFSPEMLEQCRAKNIADQLISQDATSPWALDDGSQDAVASTGLTEYLDAEELSFAIQEASRVLRPQGSLGITYYSLKNETVTQKRHSTLTLRKIFQTNGLEVKTNSEFTAYVQRAGNRMKQTLMIGVKR